MDWNLEFFRRKSRSDKEVQAHFSRKLEELLAEVGRTKMGLLPESEIRSLGGHCVLPLTRYVESDRSKSPSERERRVAAARILADLAEPWSIADLIGLLEDKDGEVRFYAAKALQRLTAQSHGEPEDWRNKSPRELEPELGNWQAWWQENKQRFPSIPP